MNRGTAKNIVRALASLAVLPLYAACWLLRPLDGNDSFFAACSQLLSLLPGKTGSYLRVAFYRRAMERCSADCFIGFGTVFSQRATVIGDRVYIGPQCNIGASRILDDTLIASGVHVLSGTKQHGIADLSRPIREQTGSFDQITIGRDCWIGNASVIMASVGDKSIVGAGSVVTQRVQEQAVAAGNPARVIRLRATDSTPPSQPTAP